MARGPTRAIRAVMALLTATVGIYTLAGLAFVAMLWGLFQVIMIFFG